MPTQRKSYYEDVVDMFRKFDTPISLSGELDEDTKLFRINAMLEELSEYVNAVSKNDYEGQLDALVDLVVFAIGTAVAQNFDFDEAWRRVHEANMNKIAARVKDDSKRGYRFDLVKPPGWKPPVLYDLVKLGPSDDELMAAAHRASPTKENLKAAVNFVLDTKLGGE